LASALQPLWLASGRQREGRRWFDALLTDAPVVGGGVADAVRARALADRAMLEVWTDLKSCGGADEALAVARQLDAPELLARALYVSAMVDPFDSDATTPVFDEATALARATGQRWLLGEILGLRAGLGIYLRGDPRVTRAAAEEGLVVAAEIGDGFRARVLHIWLANAQMMQGELRQSVTLLRTVVHEATEVGDVAWKLQGLIYLSKALAYQGDTQAAMTMANMVLAAAADTEQREMLEMLGYLSLWIAADAAGDVEASRHAATEALPRLQAMPLGGGNFEHLLVESALASGDLVAARASADEGVAVNSHMPYWAAEALLTRARVAITAGDTELAERDARDALAQAATIDAVPQILDCLALLACRHGDEDESVRLYGAADGMRRRIGVVRFESQRAEHEAATATLRDALGDRFDDVWAEGAALSVDATVAYVNRGRGRRSRPRSGWASLTPTEHDVVRLVADGHNNADIAARLFMSPRTVQSHLTHIYAKLGHTSRVQLAREADQHHRDPDGSQPIGGSA
jgi:DNA-binding CsgD family transcriptional regulator